MFTYDYYKTPTFHSILPKIYMYISIMQQYDNTFLVGSMLLFE
jgi:hypothetical protein